LKISFPHLARYHIPIKRLLQSLFPSAEILTPPPFTRRTLDLGARHSPDFVCAPFKYNLGNFIEALDLGADTLIQSGGGCRFGFYGTLQKRILSDLGYKFRFVKLIDDTGAPSLKFFRAVLKELGGQAGYVNIIRALMLAVNTIKFIDEAEYFARENGAYETEADTFKNLLTVLCRDLEAVDSLADLKRLKKSYNKKISYVQTEAHPEVLRVGIVGELYDIMEPFANRYLENELKTYGVSVSRPMDASYLLFHKRKSEYKTVKAAAPYLKYHLGADGTFSVAQAKAFAKRKYDGIIHIKPFGCTPEINAIPMLQQISKDYKIPILYFSFDTLTSETGVKTRLEAFYDILKMKKEKTCNARF